ncbi:MAG: hypothetical protein PHE20_00770 [Patescibacteria group bacterium]|nr:hypothetical protein [Patescibacteria group bacterium]
MKNKFIKQKIAFFAISLFFVLTISACSVSQQSTSNSNASENNASAVRRPDFGQPDRTADTRGIVKTIVGNEATILEVAMNSGRGTASSTNPTAEKPAVSLAGGSTGAPTGRGEGGFMGGGGPGDVSARSDMLANLKEMSTGEAKVIIPVGIRMLKSDSASDGKREMIEANLSDITADKTLTIWLDQSISDRKVAEFVLIN